MNNLQVFRSYCSNTKVTKEFQSALIFYSWCHLVEPPRQVYFCGIIYVIIQLYMGPMWLRCLKIGPFYNAVKPSFSHTAMITQRYEQFWYKPIPHNLEKLILNQWSLNDRKWLNFDLYMYIYIVFQGVAGRRPFRSSDTSRHIICAL